MENGKLSRRFKDEQKNNSKLVADIALAATQLAANARKLRQDTEVGMNTANDQWGREHRLSPE